METNQRNKSKLSVNLFIFAVGVLLGMLLFGAATWGDIEASVFHSTIIGDETLKGLECPMVISREEVGEVKVTLKNPTDKQLERTVRVHVSEGFVTVFREITSRVTIEPGGEQQLSWPVTGDDAVWNYFVMVRAYLFSNYPLPSESGSCGVLVVDLFNLPGSLIVVFTLLASLLCMGTGLWLWVNEHKPLLGRALNAAYAMGGVAAVVLGGILSSLAGMWSLSALFFVLVVLLIIGIGSYFTQTYGE